MPFDASWYTLLEECEDLDPDATLVTPLSGDRLRIADVQEHRIVVEYRGSGERHPLQREQFETLHTRIRDADGSFALDRIPPAAEPYAAVLGLHPRFEIDEREGTIDERESPLAVESDDEDGVESRTEPDLSVYADALLLIDALERHNPDAIEDLETDELVDLYTLLSDVQRGADDLRQQVTGVLLDRLHHDRPVAGQFGSVRRTSRRRRSLEDEQEVLSTLRAAGIDREQVTGVDPEKVEDALAVTELSESDVFEVDETEYVRKADVDEERKETRLQGLKDRLAASDDPEHEQLRTEIERLEARIEELTEFESGHEFYTGAVGDP
jgi:hypothetical protein